MKFETCWAVDPNDKGFEHKGKTLRRQCHLKKGHDGPHIEEAHSIGQITQRRWSQDGRRLKTKVIQTQSDIDAKLLQSLTGRKVKKGGGK